jgi:hypothetical protein
LIPVDTSHHNPLDPAGSEIRTTSNSYDAKGTHFHKYGVRGAFRVQVIVRRFSCAGDIPVRAG